MISRVEALGYRCLRYVRQDLGQFHVLVGPNASGKSTFLDVLGFMSDLVFSGPSDAVSRRAPDVRTRGKLLLPPPPAHPAGEAEQHG